MHAWSVYASLVAGVLATPARGRAQDARPAALRPPPHEGFVENRGQWDAPARFCVRRGPLTGWIDRGTIVLDAATQDDVGIRGAVVRLVFEGGRADAPIEGEDRAPGARHFLVGNDPLRWRVDVPAFRSVVCRALYEGIDLRVREGDDGVLEYDLLLAPGGDPDAVSVRCEGATGLRLDADGSLRVATGIGEFVQRPPVTWQSLPTGERRRIACRVRLQGADRFRFEVNGADRALPLVIDPGLLYSTPLGGSNNDMATGIAIDAGGNAVVAGSMRSFNFPATVGAYDTTFNGNSAGGGDAFVAKFSAASGGLVYATYLGGEVEDHVYGLALDSTGAPTVAGTTRSVAFPTTPGAFQTVLGLGGLGNLEDGFVARLSPGGDALLFGSYLGGGSTEEAWGLAVGPSGDSTIVGYTGSSNFPVTPGTYDSTINNPGGYRDVFVSRVDPSGQTLSWSTYLGGNTNDDAWCVAVDTNGEAVVGGRTESSNFPTTPGAVDTLHAGVNEGFVARFSADGASLLGCTLLGGSLSEEVHGIAVGAFGTIAVGATTSATGFPTTPGAYDTSFNGTGTVIGPYMGGDAFVARLSALGDALLSSTYLGGAENDMAFDVRADSSAVPVVAGWTFSTDFPATIGAFDTVAAGGAFMNDAFVARLAPSGASLLYSTYLGGEDRDLAYAVDLDGAGNAAVAGVTASIAFPTTPGSFQTVFYGSGSGLLWNGDGFYSRLSLLPAGASAYGASTEGCAGPLAIGTTSAPTVGNAGFALTCTAAPPGGAGFLVLSLDALGSPVPIAGADVWVGLTAFFPVLVSSDGAGYCVAPIPIPAGPGVGGFQAYLQFFWPDPCAPQGLSASNALAVAVQP